ncbi:ATP-binding protein, partial [Streptomyces sp. ISL-14]|nr:ATP-binding protein [Streptomyces sp. ISL-14]
VTSRPAAAGADWLRREEFTALHLDRMTPPDLAAFVRQWHQAVRELGEELPCTVEELPQYEQSLLNSLKDRPHLQSLAGTPLLASMLCAMHLNRGSQLPRDRMELYRNALHTLVHERDAHRNVPSAVDSRLSLGDKLVLLRDLAWRLSDNNRSEISLEQAERYVGRKLTGMRHLEERDGVRVLDQLRGRSGVLRSPAVGRLDFVHRTFQEYLAAQEATEEDRIGNLVGRAHLDIWRETIIMAAGHANRPQREELLGGILDRAEEEPRHARRLRLLAAACQETVLEFSEGLAGRLDSAVGALLPARRETDPPSLAAVGTSLLRRLPRSLGELTEKAAVQTVRTAALIGGAEALDLLAGYTDDRREPVLAELVGAWAYFDADAYADQVLAALPLRRQRVTLSHPGQLQAATRLRDISEVDIQYALREFAALADLPPLIRLNVSQRPESVDLAVLEAAHPELRLLGLGGRGPVKHLGALGDLRELRILVFGLRGVPDLEDLCLGPRFHYLSLVHADMVSLAPLARCPSITQLDLWTAQAVLPKGMDAVSGLPLLKRLTLHGVDVASWLATSQVPPTVEHLALSNCLLPDDPRALEFPGVDVQVH